MPLTRVCISKQEIFPITTCRKTYYNFYEMFPLSIGGYVIDSPGLRGFGLVDMKKEEIFHFSPKSLKQHAIASITTVSI
jgi:ribosome biogenesis GTPase